MDRVSSRLLHMRYFWFWMVLLDKMLLNKQNNLLKQRKLLHLAVTKLDGTAKGGVVLGISDRFKFQLNLLE